MKPVTALEIDLKVIQTSGVFLVLRCNQFWSSHLDLVFTQSFNQPMGRHMFSTLGVFDSSHSTQPRRHLPIRTTCFIELSMSSNSMRSSAGTRDTVWVLQSNGHSAQQNLSPTLQLHHQPAPPSIPPPALSAAMIRKTVYWFFIFFRIFLFFLFFYFFQNFFIFFVFSAFFVFYFFLYVQPLMYGGKQM